MVVCQTDCNGWVVSRLVYGFQFSLKLENRVSHAGLRTNKLCETSALSITPGKFQRMFISNLAMIQTIALNVLYLIFFRLEWEKHFHLHLVI